MFLYFFLSFFSYILSNGYLSPLYSPRGVKLVCLSPLSSLSFFVSFLFLILNSTSRRHRELAPRSHRLPLRLQDIQGPLTDGGTASASKTTRGQDALELGGDLARDLGVGQGAPVHAAHGVAAEPLPLQPAVRPRLDVPEPVDRAVHGALRVYRPARQLPVEFVGQAVAGR